MRDGTRVLRWVALLVGGGGLIFGLAGASVFYSRYSFSQTAVRASGQVIDFSRRFSSSRSSSGSTPLFYPIVQFKTGNGETVTFECSTGSNPAAYDQWERVGVLYDPKAPQEARIDSFFDLWFLPTLFCGFGVLFLGAAGIMLWLPVRARRRAEWLRFNGMRIVAEVRSIEVNRSVTVNGKHPYCIYCTAGDSTGNIREFISENLYFDPAPFVQEKHLDVWYEPKRPRRYWVDVEVIKRRHGQKG